MTWDFAGLRDFGTLRDGTWHDAWYDKNVKPCPECGGELICTERFPETRTEPACEFWECICGYENS